MQADLIDAIANGGSATPELLARLKGAILAALAARTGSICPSEVARAVAAEYRCEWRDLMHPVRRAALDLVAEGRIVVTQHGRAVDLREARGPVRLSLRRVVASTS